MEDVLPYLKGGIIMITLKINEAEFETARNGFKEKRKVWQKEFIFDKYELDLQIAGSHTWIKIDKKTKTLSVSTELNGIRIHLLRFDIETIEEDEQIRIGENIFGRFYDELKRDKSMETKERVEKLQKFIFQYVLVVNIIEAYIMTKQKDRQVKYLEIDEPVSEPKSSNNAKRKHIKKKEDRPIVIDFKDIISGRILHGRKHVIRCAKWNVRGHYRHYKNGKVVFIESFEKGKNRNKGKQINKTYTI